MIKFWEFRNESKFWERVLEEFEGMKNSNIGISGGSAGRVVEHIYDSMAAENNWFLIDERKVPKDHKDSNFGQLKGMNNELNILSPWHDSKYQEKLPEELDLVVMGVGSDGHFASLFDAPDLQKDDNKIVDTHTEKHVFGDRVSLSSKYLLKARRIVIVLIGNSKKGVLNNIKSNSGDSPITYFLRQYKGRVDVFYLR